MKTNHFLGINNSEGLDAISKSIVRINEILAERLKNDRHCFSGVEPKQLQELISGIDLATESDKSLDSIIEDISNLYIEHSVNIYSPLYMAHLHSTVSIETVIGEYLIGLLNPSLDSWDQAPFATEIDELVVSFFLQNIFGKNHRYDGVFTSGGSQSNLMGILLARDIKRQEYNIDSRRESLGQLESKFRIYCSSVSHFTIEKSAWLLGLGEQSVVKLDVDRQFKIDLKKFQEQLVKDISNNCIPICVVSTAGTTDYGSVDPIKEIAEIAKEYRMWHHIDAAYGGAMIFNPKVRWTRYLSLANSITIDLHKMLFQPISSSLFLCNNKEYIQNLNFESDYLNRKEDFELGMKNLVDKSLQTSRRFDSLKFLLTIQGMKQSGIEDILQGLLDLTRAVALYLKGLDEIELLNEPELSSLVFRYKPIGNKDIDTINRKIRLTLMGEGIVIGETRFNGNTFLKFTLLNPNAKLEDIKEVINAVLNAGHKSSGIA
ncbi:MAG: aspartate aminotransferase family protein [Moorea sp. SIO3I7]|uniref:pyridoxal phosphate-dependent decarboxylase family protein n=1 Tax=Moorena sp. SIO3I8 TaxID=2607833 RepID=UPI0013BF136F|nr:aspartate aminotransferase family protein [Moorena sp. SIO3I8]NEN94132.1 aspartate aminotransferase family protein [Moorena sp. SIO3I7]NEO05764.1 aspartate aminotransferase family protein [Moorena sp. SIO3I8]